VVAVHEAFHEQAAGLLGGVEGALHLGRPPVERLLAEDVLARLERADRPLDVERVRERDVQGVELGIGEQLVVGAVGPLEAVLARVVLGAPAVAAADGDDLDPVGEARAAEDGPVDPRRREEPEADGLGQATRPARRARRPSPRPAPALLAAARR
jgi:hypothetical protein